MTFRRSQDLASNMLAFVLLTIVATAVATDTAPAVDTNELYKLGLTGIYQRWASMLHDGVTDFISSTKLRGQLLISGIIPYLPHMATEGTRILNDLKQEKDVAELLQLVQKAPMTAAQCLMAWGMTHYYSIAPSFFLLTKSLLENNVNGVPEITNLEDFGALDSLYPSLTMDKLYEFLTLDAVDVVLRFFFENILPTIIEIFVVMVARPNVYQAGLNLTSWLGSGLEDAAKCEMKFINKNIIPRLEYMVNE